MRRHGKKDDTASTVEKIKNILEGIIMKSAMDVKVNVKPVFNVH